MSGAFVESPPPQMGMAAANRFGLYDTLERICVEVQSETGGKDASLDVVTAAIKRVEALRS